MARRVDPERTRHAALTGAVMAVRDRLRRDREGRFERLQEVWREMAARIDKASNSRDW